jgi:hypothetical protein
MPLSTMPPASVSQVTSCNGFLTDKDFHGLGQRACPSKHYSQDTSRS